MKPAYKLAKLFDESLNTEIRNRLIFADKHGTYKFFGVFNVQRLGDRLYEVTDLQTEATHRFMTLKNAAAWCILVNYGHHTEASTLEGLDMKLTSKELDRTIHKKILKNYHGSSNRVILYNKVQEDSFRIRQLTLEIDNYIKKSVKLQNMRFSHNRNAYLNSNLDK